ncbi:MAG: EI24 domain-containing protein [Victivallales bacterium]|nr:EI24 domain-containing protein [Victivallales bacterium]
MKPAVADSFTQGIQYVFLGILDFYRLPRLWRYAILPLSVIILLSLLVIWQFFASVLPLLMVLLEGCFPWLVWLIRWAAILLFFSVLTLLGSSCYEIFGAFFFPQMVRIYEAQFYNWEGGRQLTMREELRNMLDSAWYSTVTLLLLLLLTVMGWAFPGAGQLLTALVIGYRYAISYMGEAGFNRGYSLSTLSAISARRSWMVYGFGVTVYLLLLIPVLSLLLIPGFILGGTRLVNEQKTHY